MALVGKRGGGREVGKRKDENEGWVRFGEGWGRGIVWGQEKGAGRKRGG